MEFGVSSGWRVALIVLIAVTVLAVVPVGVAAQGGSDGEGVEVRIAARRVASERVEFGLQQRAGGGDWGVRLLPQQRLFPLGTSQGRWLVSAPLMLSGVSLEVRIAARRVAGGRVEFALQQRAGGGDWGARLLPQQRLFPVGTPRGQWLASSPLAVFAGDVEPPLPIDDDVVPEPDEPEPDRPPDPPVDPAAELASLVSVGANSVRGGLAPLVLDGGLSAAAQQRAEAQAASGDWLHDFDYDARLASGWGVWFAGKSASINSAFDNIQAARMLSEVLLNEKGHRVLGCELCTHLGVGAATRRGRTYATVVVAGPAPPGDAIAAAEAQMAGLVNRLREGLGLEALSYHDSVAVVARRWSQTQAAEGDQYHNPHFSEQYPPGLAPRRGERRLAARARLAARSGAAVV